MTLAPTPAPGTGAALEFVERYLGDVLLPGAPVTASERFVGGQVAADEALAALDITGYAQARHTVYPQPERGASSLSPYIRHGLIQLADVWQAVEGAGEADRNKYRNHLLWQEFARHWYARLGSRTRKGMLNEQVAPTRWRGDWDDSMACLELSVDELEDDGWLVNQNRLWLASHWAVRHGGRWQDGEDYLFRHLLDGSRAANRLGWQWATGVGSSQAYGFTRWQVEERAAGLCSSCDRVYDCPIEDFPSSTALAPVAQPVSFGESAMASKESLVGPRSLVGSRTPEVVWLTAESLGMSDPALRAHPDLPLVFVFDHALLTRLKLTAKRLVFMVEALSELALVRQVELHIGDPVELLADRACAVTHAPVPGFARRAALIEPAEVHPWPWLVEPTEASVRSFSSWLRARSAIGETEPDSVPHQLIP